MKGDRVFWKGHVGVVEDSNEKDQYIYVHFAGTPFDPNQEESGRIIFVERGKWEAGPFIDELVYLKDLANEHHFHQSNNPAPGSVWNVEREVREIPLFRRNSHTLVNLYEGDVVHYDEHGQPKGITRKKDGETDMRIVPNPEPGTITGRIYFHKGNFANAELRSLDPYSPRLQALYVGGIDLVIRERMRQIHEEGWTAKHDDAHDRGSLALAGACYAIPPEERDTARLTVPYLWPFDEEWWKPTDDRMRELVKAAALIVAEIDRELRLRAAPTCDACGETIAPPAQPFTIEDYRRICPRCWGVYQVIQRDWKTASLFVDLLDPNIKEEQ